MVALSSQPFNSLVASLTSAISLEPPNTSRMDFQKRRKIWDCQYYLWGSEIAGTYLGLRKNACLIPSQLDNDLKEEADQARVESNC